MKRATLFLILLGGVFSCTGCQTIGQVAKAAAVEAFELAKPQLVELGRETAGKAVLAAERVATRTAAAGVERVADRVGDAIDKLPGPIRDAAEKLESKAAAALLEQRERIAAKPEDERTPWELLLLAGLMGVTGVTEGRKWLRDRDNAAKRT